MKNLFAINEIVRTTTRLFFCVGVLAIFASCVDEPEQKKIIGSWTEKYHVSVSVKSLSFKEDGALIYSDKPDTTWPVYPTGGISLSMQYSILEDNKLFIYFNEKNQIIEPFEYVTDYCIKANTLTIDSFSCDGASFSKPLILYKE